MYVHTLFSFLLVPRCSGLSFNPNNYYNIEVLNDVSEFFQTILTSRNRNHTALWVYFWMFVLGAFLLGGMIATGQVERHRAEAAQALKQHDEEEAQAMIAT